MNRRTLFKTVAAGMAWIAGNRLPATAATRPHPVEKCGCARCRARANGGITVWNGGKYKISAGSVVEWTGFGRGVKVADLGGEFAGVAMTDARHGEPLEIAVSGPVTVLFKA